MKITLTRKPFATSLRLRSSPVSPEIVTRSVEEDADGQLLLRDLDAAASMIDSRFSMSQRRVMSLQSRKGFGRVIMVSAVGKPLARLEYIDFLKVGLPSNLL